MAHLGESFNAGLYMNWLKALHITFVTRQGLKNVVTNTADRLYQDAMSKRNPEHELDETGKCTVCDLCQEAIITHVKETYKPFTDGENVAQLNLDNMNEWIQNSWKVAVCFMQEYYAGVLNFSKTDFNGVIRFMRTCSYFDGSESLCKEVST